MQIESPSIIHSADQGETEVDRVPIGDSTVTEPCVAQTNCPQTIVFTPKRTQPTLQL